MNKMPKLTMRPSYLFYFLLIFVAFLVAFWYFSRKPEANKNLEAFAQCLKDKGVIMYGASWCPHCQEEKKRFGPAFKYISYVECPQEPKKCLEMDIKGYPTWIFSDGRKFEGEQGLEKLAEISGCSL